MSDMLPRKHRAVQVYFPQGYNADAWHLAQVLQEQGTTLGQELMQHSLEYLLDKHSELIEGVIILDVPSREK